jgi:hypothetical protein
MNGKKRFFAALILGTGFIAALCTACSYPIGSLMTEPGLGVAENKLIIEKNIKQYYVGETFNPVKDFELYVISVDGRKKIENIENSGVVIIINGDGATYVISGKEKILEGYKFQSAKPELSIDIYLAGLSISYEVFVEEKTGGNSTGILVKYPD